ncbi:MAG: hypothetical protein WCF67_11150 [Chitinophagaceae bacterium]
MSKAVKFGVHIWLIAVVANTVLEAFYITGFRLDLGTCIIMFYGLCIGLIFTLPVFAGICLVINRCIATRMPGIWTFWLVLVAGIILTTLMFLLLMHLFGGLGGFTDGLFAIAILSAITGVCCTAKALLNLPASETTLNVADHEN